MKTVVKNKDSLVRRYKDGTTASFRKMKSNGKSKWVYTGGSKRPKKKK
jgi:hypothetical protein